MKLAGREFEEVMSIDFLLWVATGEVAGFKHVHKFWENPLVTDVEETIWDQGGLYSYLTEATTLKVSSTDAADTEAGTGARTIRIDGLDANYNEISDDITLSGQTQVDTSKQFLRVFRVTVLTAGTGGTAAGDIYVGTGAATLGVPANVYATIKIGNNQTLMGLYTVPAGYSGFLRFWKTSSPAGKSAKVKFFARPLGGVFNIQHTVSLYQNNYDYPFFIPLEIQEKTDLEVRAISEAAGATMTIAFDVIMIKNTPA